MTEQRVCEQTVASAATNAKAQIVMKKAARGACSAWMRCGIPPPYVVNDDSRGDRVCAAAVIVLVTG